MHSVFEAIYWLKNEIWVRELEWEEFRGFF